MIPPDSSIFSQKEAESDKPPMEIEEYSRMRENEGSHWWYLATRKAVFSAVTLHLGTPPGGILDAGCGTGMLVEEYFRRFPAAFVCGLDMSEEALSFSRRRGAANLLRASVLCLPFKEGSFQLVSSIDVISHGTVADDEAAVSEMARTLKPGGLMVLQVPAYEWLRSTHDKAVHTKRRYTKARILRLLSSCGLEAERVTYRNSFLLPPAFIFRKAKNLLAAAGLIDHKSSDLAKAGPLVNFCFHLLATAETLLLPFISLPFGTSVFAVARKPTESTPVARGQTRGNGPSM